MNLLNYVEQAVDPRDAHGLRHPVAAMLKMVLLALISGIKCVEHFGVYAKENWEELADELGFTHWHPPDGETFRLLLSRMKSTLLTEVFENWMSDFLKDKVYDVALDGKACRGVIAEGKPAGKGVQLLNVFAHDLQVVLTQWSLESKKGESTVAKANMAHLIEKYPGIRLLTGDAGLSGRDLCQTIINYKKDYLIRIKGNQKDVEDALLFWFEARLKANPKADAKTVEKKKDRTITRELFLCEPDIAAYVRDEFKFPGVQQAAILRKTDCNKGVKTVETWCLLTSASLEKLSPKAFLETIQKHWQIEDGLHHVKDRSMKEDEHVTHSPQQETSLAILRNVAVSILNLMTPPKRRKESRPTEMLRHCFNPVKLLKQLQTL